MSRMCSGTKQNYAVELGQATMQVKGEYCCLDMILRIDTACLFPLHCEVPHFCCELTGVDMFMQGGGWGRGWSASMKLMVVILSNKDADLAIIIALSRYHLISTDAAEPSIF